MPHRIRRAIAASLALLVGPTMSAQSEPAPAPSGASLFTYRDLLLAGGIVATTLAVRPTDEYYARRLQDSSAQASRRLRRLAAFMRTTAEPGAVMIGTTMYAAGRLTKNDRLAQLGLHGTEALLIGEAAGSFFKGVFGRQRPYVTPQNSHSFDFFRGFRGGDAFRSFPSGHTVAAFAVAAAVTSETAGWWPDSRWYVAPAMYGGAALVGVSRMYNNRHWASDVIIGAGVGTFAGLKVVRYHRAHPGTGFDRWLLAGSLVPTADGGHALRWSLMPDLRATPVRHAP